MPVAVALSQDGRQVVDFLWSNNGKLLNVSDTARLRSIALKLTTLGLNATMPQATGMLPRSNFKVVFDSARARVLVMGGTRTIAIGKGTFQRNAGDLWVYDILGQSWRSVPVDLPVKQVLAAQMADDGRLWLHERDSTTTRLRAIDLVSGESTVLMERQQAPASAASWLGLDFNGNLVASGSRGTGTKLFLISDSDGLKVSAKADVTGVLAMEPVADTDGLRLFLTGTSAFGVQRIESISTNSNAGQFLEQCM